MKFLLPFKGLKSAKSRWPQLGNKRDELVLGLVARNLRTVVEVVGPEQVYLVCPDTETLSHFSSYRHVKVAGSGLNPDLREARHRVLKTDSQESLAVLLPDLPNLGVQDVKSLVELCSSNDLVLCPDTEDVGTNALALKQGWALDFLFEGASFARHSKAADDQGLQTEVLRRPGLAEDCDDLEALRRFCLL